MKTKKILSLLLAVVMVFSMMATLAFTVNAGSAKSVQCPDCYNGYVCPVGGTNCHNHWDNGECTDDGDGHDMLLVVCTTCNGTGTVPVGTWVKVEKYGKTFWYRTGKVSHYDGENEEAWECECWNLIIGKFDYSKPDEYNDGCWMDEYPCEHLVEYEPLTSLVMKPNSAKTKYVVGDKIDLTGAKMTATTISETIEDVTITSSMVSGFDSTTAGKKTVTVTYRNLTTSFDVTVAPQNECYLDLEAETDYDDHRDIDQNYNLTVEEGDQTGVTKVKLEWNVTDINVTRKDAQKWDTTELKWVADDENGDLDVTAGGAVFTLTNYSDVKVDAKVTFATAEYEEGKKFSAPTLAYNEGTNTEGKDDGVITLDTANGDSTYSKENAPTGKIAVTVTPVEDDFAELAATTSAKKYGTYTVTISQVKEMVTLTFTGENSHSTLSYGGTEYAYGKSFSISVPKNSTVSIANAGTAESTLTVDGKTVTQTASGGWMALWSGVSNGTVITESVTICSASCILSGSKVTLADGSTKVIDDVTTEDTLMTFNFYEGKLDGNCPMYIMKHENTVACVITVTLDNGTTLEMCDWQQFFDMDEKTYFDVDAVNYPESVGRNVMFIENGVVTTAKIVDATMQVRTCTSFEIFTEYNKNFVANGILTVEPETYLQGVYTIGDDLKIDAEQYQKDVDTYGRYTYEEFADVMTKDEFDVMNIADKKIAVGKGTVSEEWLFALYAVWSPMYR